MRAAPPSFSEAFMFFVRSWTIYQRFSGERRPCQRKDDHLPHILEAIDDEHEIFCPGLGDTFRIIQDRDDVLEFQVEIHHWEDLYRIAQHIRG